MVPGLRGALGGGVVPGPRGALGGGVVPGPRGALGGGHGLVDGATASDNQDEWASGVASKDSASVHVEPDAPHVSVPSSPTSSDRPASPDPDPALDAA